MMFRIMCASVAVPLFFGEAYAQDTKYVYLKTCAEHATKSDPSILSRKVIDAQHDCGNGRPVKVVLVDVWYGFEAPAKTLRDIPAEPKMIAPSETNVFKTHKPCRVAYPHEGVLAEWLIPRTEECGGLPTGSYHRVYTPKNEVCLRPNGGCISIKKLSPLAQERFEQMLGIAYAELAHAQ